MNFRKTEIEGLIIVEPEVFRDERGFFMETYHLKKFTDGGIKQAFVQLNHAHSVKNTLRGLHFQFPQVQSKLVWCVSGAIFNVAVDVRKTSQTFGKWFGINLSVENKLQFFVPVGFAHGYCVLSETADVSYAVTDFYAPHHEGGIIWNDPALNISWPVKNPLVSGKDRLLPSFSRLPSPF